MVETMNYDILFNSTKVHMRVKSMWSLINLLQFPSNETKKVKGNLYIWRDSHDV